MVTKAELEAQVAELRRQLAEQSDNQKSSADHKSDGPAEAAAEKLTDNLEAWSTQLDEALTELEDLPHKRPILFALGIFAVGYLLGRSR